MLQSTKKILEELYEVSPSLKWDEEKLAALISMLEQYNPDVKMSPKFKSKLLKKLTTIGEFKQIQPKQKFNAITFMRPLFFMVFWVFLILQFQNFLHMNEENISKIHTDHSEEFQIGPSEWSEPNDTQDESDANIENQTANEVDDDSSSSRWEDSEKSATENSSNDSNEQSQDRSSSVKETQSTPSSEKEIVKDDIMTTPKLWSSDEAQNTVNEVENSSTNQDSRSDTSQRSTPKETTSDDWTDWAQAEQDLETQNTDSPTNTTPQAEIKPLDDSNSEAASDSEINPQSDIYSENDTNTDTEEVETSAETPIEGNAMQAEEDMHWDSSADFGASTSSTTDKYYQCEWPYLVHHDSVHLRKIIKQYCDENGGNVLADPNIENYKCQLNELKKVWIDYIERDLCQ